MLVNIVVTVISVAAFVLGVAASYAASQNPDEAPKGTKEGARVLIVVGLLGAIVGTTCIAEVGTAKVAVVTRFGAIVGEEGPGLHLKLPIDSYNVIDTSQQQVEDVFSTATKDKQSVNQSVTAQVMVDPASAQALYGRFLGNHMDGLVYKVMADSVKSASAKYSIEDIIDMRDQEAQTILDTMQRGLASYGITVVSVQITNAELPAEYVAAVERLKVAERDKETSETLREKADIDAQTNEILAATLEDEILSKMIIEKWDGKLPLYVGGDSNGLDVLLPSQTDVQQATGE